jgi:ribonuclease G
VAKQLFINVAAWETRVALLDDNQIVDLQFERRAARSLSSNIYLGRVQRVLPGMQAAFCEIGLEKAAFLHASDLVWTPLPDQPDAPPEPELPVDVIETPDADDLVDLPLDEAAPDEPAETDDAPAEGRPRPRRTLRPIQDRLQQGDQLMLQISKEPIGSKGARVTAHISLPGRFLVYMPSTRHVGISRRIEDSAERDRLRALVEVHRPPDGGFIVRTACEGMTEQEIQEDIQFLTKLWARIQQKAAQANAPTRLHQDLDLALRTIRDLFTTEVERVVIDDRAAFDRVHDFVEGLMPQLLDRVEFHGSPTPLFDAFGVETKIARALDRRVWLKSGGYLVFDQTESLTTVDVNTGRFVGKQDQSETVLKTNLEAARTVIQQLRVRNIGGIIVIDFIDMDSAEHRQQVFDVLQEAARNDKARSNMLAISELGLVQMTRKRTRESLGQLMTAPCAQCHGSGHVRSTETLAFDALRAVTRRAATEAPCKAVRLAVPRHVADYLVDHEVRALRALGDQLGAPLHIDADDELAADGTRITFER